MTLRPVSDAMSCWALALVVAAPMPAARVAAVNIGFMGSLRARLNFAHGRTLRQESDRTMMSSCENCGWPQIGERRRTVGHLPPDCSIDLGDGDQDMLRYFHPCGSAVARPGRGAVAVGHGVGRAIRRRLTGPKGPGSRERGQPRPAPFCLARCGPALREVQVRLLRLS